jgi:hypothetical protein
MPAGITATCIASKTSRGVAPDANGPLTVKAHAKRNPHGARDADHDQLFGLARQSAVALKGAVDIEIRHFLEVLGIKSRNDLVGRILRPERRLLERLPGRFRHRTLHN